MAINTTAYDWSANNFGLAEWDDISWAFSELGSGQFFDSYLADNFTPYDSPDDFSYTAVSAATAPTLSSVSAASEPTFAALSVGSTSYSEQSITAPIFTDMIIAGEN